jgi:hypothetical protein
VEDRMNGSVKKGNTDDNSSGSEGYKELCRAQCLLDDD